MWTSTWIAGIISMSIDKHWYVFDRSHIGRFRRERSPLWLALNGLSSTNSHHSHWKFAHWRPESQLDAFDEIEMESDGVWGDPGEELKRFSFDLHICLFFTGSNRISIASMKALDSFHLLSACTDSISCYSHVSTFRQLLFVTPFISSFHQNLHHQHQISFSRWLLSSLLRHICNS